MFTIVYIIAGKVSTTPVLEQEGFQALESLSMNGNCINDVSRICIDRHTLSFHHKILLISP